MGGGTLGWQVDERDDARIVAPTGRVDESTATEFTERLASEVAAAGAGRAVLDLSGIAYMSSRGLRALTLAQRKGSEAGATIVLARPGETMREILAISRYDMVFKVFETIDEALAG
jgi:anti-sigma B factor antagonist